MKIKNNNNNNNKNKKIKLKMKKHFLKNSISNPPYKVGLSNQHHTNLFEQWERKNLFNHEWQ